MMEKSFDIVEKMERNLFCGSLTEGEVNFIWILEKILKRRYLICFKKL